MRGFDPNTRRGRILIDYALPTEHEEQSRFIEWANLYANILDEHGLRLLFAIPNGGKRSIKTAKALKAEGVRSGVPDLFLPVPRRGYCGCFIEMKRSKRGTISPAQAVFHAELALQGYMVLVCRGCEDAKKQVLQYLGRECAKC